MKNPLPILFQVQRDPDSADVCVTGLELTLAGGVDKVEGHVKISYRSFFQV
jgi:hypothetical protein